MNPDAIVKNVTPVPIEMSRLYIFYGVHHVSEGFRTEAAEIDNKNRLVRKHFSSCKGVSRKVESRYPRVYMKIDAMVIELLSQRFQCVRIGPMVVWNCPTATPHVVYFYENVRSKRVSSELTNVKTPR